VVIDEDSGQVLYERGSSQRTAPASITKIMTALVAIERGKPEDRFKVEFDSTELVDSTLMGIHPGDEVTLEDLLYGLMLPSGNDAALAIANHIAGSKQAFVQMMIDKARDLGLQNTHFQNPHGLDEAGHYTSAYDITMTARYAMQHYPLF
jgi:D-alanyl-D-alanine carboxypeptidase